MADKGTVLVTNDAGTPWVKMLVATATWDPASTATSALSTTTTVTVAGASVGDPVVAALTTNTTTGGQLFAAVTAADTVRVGFFNMTTSNPLDLASGTLKVVVFKI